MNTNLPNPYAPPRGFLNLALPLLVWMTLMTVPSLVVAQERTIPQNGLRPDPVVLSPFVVDGAQDQGYLATQTLSGTRTRTSLRDLASAVTVVTDKLIADTAASDINDLFLFLPNAEGTEDFTVGGANSNGFFTSGNTGPQLAGVSNGSLEESGTDRVRGLENVTLSRDFFQTNIPLDTYNIARVDLNRGPNAILFGLGKSSGILNYSLKRATLEDHRHEVSVRAGTDESFRGTFDVNRIIWEDRSQRSGAAVRVIGLHEEDGVRGIKPAYDEDRRLYLSGLLTWKGNTTLHVNHERIDRRISRPSNIGALDGISSWAAAGAPVWNPAVGGTLPNGLSLSGFNTDIVAFHDSASWEAGQPLLTMPARFPNGILSNGRNFIFARSTSVNETIAFGGASSFAPEVLKGVLKRVSIDPSALTVHDNKVWSAGLQHQVFQDVEAFGAHHSLGAQATYYDEDSRQTVRNAFHERFPIFIDVNETLPTGDLDGGGQPIFAPNPNFLRPFSFARQYWLTNHVNQQQTGALELSYIFERKGEGRGKWFNRVTLNGLLQENRTDNTPNMNIHVLTTRPDAIRGSSVVTAPGFTGVFGGPQVGNVLYLGPAVDRNAPLESLRIDALPDSRPLDTQLDNFVFYDGAAKRWDRYRGSDPLRSAMIPAALGNRIRQKISTAAVVANAMLLRERLSLTYGLRQDDVTLRASGIQQRDPGSGQLLPDSLTLAPVGTKVSGDTTTLGVVAHVLPWLSLHYNEADNFVPVGTRTNVFGFEIEPPKGEGRDYGFSLNLLKEKLRLKVNWFDTDQTARGDNTTTSLASLRIFRFETWALQRHLESLGRGSEWRSIEQTNADRLGPFGFAGVPDAPNGADPTYSSTTSFESEGLEIELFYNPTPRWTVMASIAQQKAVQGVVAGDLAAYMDLRGEFYRTLSVWNTINPFGFNPTLTNSELWEEHRNSLAASKINEGKLNDQIREWSFKLVTNYDFTDGPLKNLSVGGALRWLDHAVIGYATTVAPDGSTVLDPDQPFFGDTTLEANLWFRYRTRIFDIPTTLQLNLNNLLEGGDLRAVSRNINGDVRTYSYNPPRAAVVTATFRF